MQRLSPQQLGRSNLNKPDATHHADLIERLIRLEYAIRQSMTVREDQDEPANPEHREEAARYGIAVQDAATKEELLNAVQTMLRARQKKSLSKSGNA